MKESINCLYSQRCPELLFVCLINLNVYNKSYKRKDTKRRIKKKKNRERETESMVDFKLFKELDGDKNL